MILVIGFLIYKLSFVNNSTKINSSVTKVQQQKVDNKIIPLKTSVKSINKNVNSIGEEYNSHKEINKNNSNENSNSKVNNSINLNNKSQQRVENQWNNINNTTNIGSSNNIENLNINKKDISKKNTILKKVILKRVEGIGVFVGGRKIILIPYGGGSPRIMVNKAIRPLKEENIPYLPGPIGEPFAAIKKVQGFDTSNIKDKKGNKVKKNKNSGDNKQINRKKIDTKKIKENKQNEKEENSTKL